MHSRLGLFIACSKRVNRSSSSSSLLSALFTSPLPFQSPELTGRVSNFPAAICSYFSVFNPSTSSGRHYCSYFSQAAEQFSDDEYECDYDNQPVNFFIFNLLKKNSNGF